MNNDLITKEDFYTWKNNRVTRAFMSYVDARCAEIITNLLGKDVSSKDLSQVAAHSIGAANELNRISQCDLEDLNAAIDD